MPLSNPELIVLNDVQWALDTACISAELDLTLREITDDGNLPLYSTFTTQNLERFVKSVCVTGKTNPVAIYEHLSHLFIAEIFSSQLLKLLNTPIL